MSSPIDIDISIMPRAPEMIAAIKACVDGKQITLNKTPGGKTGASKLSLKCDKLKVFVPILPDDYALLIPEPDGVDIPVTSNLMNSIHAAIPFCADGKGPAWSQGVRFKGASVFATNSIVLLESFHGGNFPTEFIIPVQAAKELAKIKEAITRLQVGHSSVTFWFGDRWLRTALVQGNWPDNVEPMFGIKCEQTPVPDGFFDAIRTLSTLGDDSRKLYFTENFIGTSPAEEDGASVELHVAAAGIFPLEMLLLLEGTASTVGWTHYPKPCPFRGPTADSPTIRGIILGFQR
jgi:hypothetical protein